MVQRRLLYTSAILFCITVSLTAQTNSWQFTGGPYYGAATALVCNSQGVVFAGTKVGVFRSTDDGTTWEWITQNAGTFDVSALIATGNDAVYMGLTNGSVYCSTDNGVTWSVKKNGLPDNPITALQSRGADTIFAVTDTAGIFRSTNDGATWQSINTGLTNLAVQCFAAPSHGNIFAGTKNGAFYSPDQGSTWDTVSGLGTGTITMLSANSNGIVFTTNQKGTNIFTYKSTDDGATWTNISVTTDSVYNPLTHKWSISHLIEYFPGFWQCDSSGSFYTMASYSTYGYINKSTDNGVTWNSKYQSLNGGIGFVGQLMLSNSSAYDSAYIGTMNTMCFSPKGYVYIGSEKGGILRFSNNDFSTWSRGTQKIAGRSVYSMITSGGNIFSMTEGGLYRSLNRGATWECGNHYVNINAHCLDVDSKGTLFLADDSLYSSTDFGESWNALPITGFTVAVNKDDDIFAGGYLTSIDRSIDQGHSWQSLSMYGCSTLVAGKSGNLYGIGGSMFIESSDVGTSWKTISSITSLIKINIYSSTAFAIQSCAEIHGKVFLGVYSGVIVSSDTGTTWSYQNQGLPLVVKLTNYFGDSTIQFYDFPIITAITSNANGDVFIGSDHGIYYWPHGGDQWHAFNQGLPASVSVSSLAIDSSGYLYAGTTDGMIFKSTLTTTGIKSEKNTIPLTWNLQQNYPNPFNPSTKINYQLASKTYVTLKVYDVLGREVATLVDGYQIAGQHISEWNGTKNASGIYFVTLRTNSYTKTMKMLLLK